MTAWNEWSSEIERQASDEGMSMVGKAIRAMDRDRSGATAGEWDHVKSMIRGSGDDWTEAAAPFAACARMILRGRGGKDEGGPVGTETASLLQDMIRLAFSWSKTAPTDDDGSIPAGIILHGDRRHGASSLWEHMGRRFVCSAMPGSEPAPGASGSRHGRNMESLGWALMDGSRQALLTVSRIVPALTMLEPMLPAEPDLLLEGVRRPCYSPYSHILHMLTALAEGMTANMRTAPIRLRMAILTQGGWDPALETGIADGSAPRMVADYSTDGDMTLWVADMVQGMHQGAPAAWPRDPDDAGMLTAAAEHILHAWDHADPAVLFRYAQHPGTLIRAALPETVEPDFPGEAWLLDRLIRMLRITPWQTVMELDRTLYAGGTGTLRRMLEDSIRIGAPAAVMNAIEALTPEGNSGSSAADMTGIRDHNHDDDADDDHDSDPVPIPV